MGTRKACPLPVGLERVRRRFERWRQTRKIPSRIPEPLWTAAARMAGTYGISRTANTLRINYIALKRRVDGGAPAGGPVGRAVDGPKKCAVAARKRAERGMSGPKRAERAMSGPKRAGRAMSGPKRAGRAVDGPKKRAVAARGPKKRVGGQGIGSAPAFFELAPPVPIGACQCTMELEDASGAKMRVHLQGGETPDLAALSRSFWNSGP